MEIALIGQLLILKNILTDIEGDIERNTEQFKKMWLVNLFIKFYFSLIESRQSKLIKINF